MKKQRLLTKPTRTSDLTFDELYDEISDDWSYKARQLQTRRWRKLKREIKGSVYAKTY